ncbi:Uma2 family endonuclease [Tibeticola sediminis]|uniref:Uma2 family endonuclease n=1 Tax=Tibeticola sediminis TaxID=1917811 RepID=A0A3N4TX07_9BURK|nr:Uma2 family endonuclease [Tibeticola sediminis]RPE62992.1 Uma2 family endonuclease [Tibeticola sediminis]
MTALAQPKFGAEDYLAWEANQPVKHEYLAGEVFAMAGGSDAHVTVSLNLASALRSHLRGTPCRTYIADMKLRVAAADAYFYPDVFVTCSAADAQQPLAKAEPVLVAEVLSPSTEAFDRGGKFAAYRSLPSLQEYVLIDPDRRSVEIYRRDASGHWVLYPYSGDEVLELGSVHLSLPLAQVFEDVAPAVGAGASSDA